MVRLFPLPADYDYEVPTQEEVAASIAKQQEAALYHNDDIVAKAIASQPQFDYTEILNTVEF